MSTSISEINRIVRRDPIQLKFLFKSPLEDKRRLTRLISHLVPYRVGIEFETFGSVGNYVFPNLTKGQLRRSNIDDKLCKYFKITAFREDEHIDEWPPEDKVYREDERDMNEVRVSFSGYKQLIPFWNTIQTLKKCLVIPKINGGIHIHIDAPFVKEKEGMDYAVKWFDRDCILNEVLQIFEGYKGTYNQRHASKTKANWIRVSEYPTIEFRIARLTYDYKTLIRWIIACSDLVRRCKTDYLSNVEIKDDVKPIKKHQSTRLDPDNSVTEPDEERQIEVRISQEQLNAISDATGINRNLLDQYVRQELERQAAASGTTYNQTARWRRLGNTSSYWTYDMGADYENNGLCEPF